MLEASVISHITEDQCSWEGDVLPRLAAEGQLGAYRHPGFWQPMDTQGLLEVCLNSPGWVAAPTLYCAGTAPDPWPPSPPPRLLMQAI